MQRATIPLDLLTIPVPCHASWDEMRGTDRVRFCGECRQHVYNLSEMTRPQAEALVASKGGKLCGRFARRPDGTVMTRDCGLVKRTRRAVATTLAVALGLLLSFVGWLGYRVGRVHMANGGRPLAREVEPLATVLEWIDPTLRPYNPIAGGIGPPPLMTGDVCLPHPPDLPPGE